MVPGILPSVEFREALAELGFVTDRPTRGADLYVKRHNPYLTYWVHAYEDGTALFTWEFAIGEYVATLGMQVGSDEHLNTFLYPAADVRGTQDPVWLVQQMDHAEARLRSLSLVDPEAPPDGGG